MAVMLPKKATMKIGAQMSWSAAIRFATCGAPVNDDGSSPRCVRATCADDALGTHLRPLSARKGAVEKRVPVVERRGDEEGAESRELRGSPRIVRLVAIQRQLADQVARPAHQARRAHIRRQRIRG